MQENSHFDQTAPAHDAIEYIPTAGATCDTYRVKYYGKWHFLKRLKQQYASSASYQQAFRKEFETGYPLEHPNLVRYLSLSDDGILMEYVDGETLTAFLQSHPDYFCKRKNSDKFLEQMLSVLQYLHEHQVLHLDLKPDNILITRIGHNVKLIDLGGCYTDCFTDTTAHTDAYAAPEQLSALSHQGTAVSESTDLYALGCILRQLPCGSRYQSLVSRCTQPQPADRFQSAEEIMQVLQRRYSLNRWYTIVSILAVCAVIVGLFLMFQCYQFDKDAVKVAEPIAKGVSMCIDTLTFKKTEEFSRPEQSLSELSTSDNKVSHSIKKSKEEKEEEDWKRICLLIHKNSDQLAAAMYQKIEHEGMSPIMAYAEYYEKPLIIYVRSILAKHHEWEFAIGTETNKHQSVVLNNILNMERRRARSNRSSSGTSQTVGDSTATKLEER